MCSSTTRSTASASGPERLSHLDCSVLLIARTRGHSPSADRAVATFSRLGEHGGGWIALGIAGALLDHDPQRRSAWRHGTAITLAAYGLNQTLKFVIRRPRPEL